MDTKRIIKSCAHSNCIIIVLIEVRSCNWFRLLNIVLKVTPMHVAGTTFIASDTSVAIHIGLNIRCHHNTLVYIMWALVASFVT